jgi:hypothetical protein
LRRVTRLALFVLAALVGVALLWMVGDRSAASLLGLTLSIGGAAMAAYLVRDAPVATFGILFALAAISRVTVELPPGTMRLEQPGIAAVLVALAAQRRAWPRPTSAATPIVVGLTLFVGSLALSSALMAPRPIDSLRIVAWYMTSIGGGFTAFLLLRRRSDEATPWFSGVGAVAGGAGLLAAVLFFVIGESWSIGIQGIPDFPRVYAFAWEGNLFASFLAAVLPFATERFREAPSIARAGTLLVIAIGFALAITRGAYLGLAAGLLVQFGALWYWRRGWQRLIVPAAVVAACLIVSLLAPSVLLPSNRPSPPIAANPSFGAPSATGSANASGNSQGSGSGRPSASAPTATAVPTPTPRPYPDTVGYRLARVGPALNDLSSSVVIGLGADTFGQRHLNEEGDPDHIGLLIVALPYESGIVGAAGFVLAATALLMQLARSLRGPGATALAAAYLGSIVSLLVAYQATNAIHFAINWLIAGAAAALVADAMRVTRGQSSTRPEAVSSQRRAAEHGLTGPGS